jgi:TolA-binding protein
MAMSDDVTKLQRNHQQEISDLQKKHKQEISDLTNKLRKLKAEISEMQGIIATLEREKKTLVAENAALLKKLRG